MKKPAFKSPGKAAREICFMTNRVHTLEAQLKRLRELKKDPAQK